MAIPIPLRIISFGGGVQSSVLALMASRNELDSMPECAIFADTQDEPASVYIHIEWISTQLNFPIHKITAGKLSDKALDMRVSAKGGKFSLADIPLFTKSADGEIGKIWQRSCTRDFKIVPIIKKIRSIAGKERMAAWRNVKGCVGFNAKTVSRQKCAIA